MLWRGLFGGGAASGAAGALVASHNHGGQYVRARTTPTNPRSAQQQAVRDAVSTLSAQWASVLTQDQRDSWGVYSRNVTRVNRIGDSILISGIAWYVANNVPRVQSGLAIIRDAPTQYDRGNPGGINNFNMTAGSDTVVVDIDGANDSWNVTGSGNTLLLYASRPQSPGVNFFAGPFRLVGGFPAPGTTNRFSGTLPFTMAGSQNSMFFQWRISYADGRLSGVSSGVGFPG